MKDTIQDEARTVKELTTILLSFKEAPNSANMSRSRSLGAASFDGKENHDEDPQVWPAPPDPRRTVAPRGSLSNAPDLPGWAQKASSHPRHLGGGPTMAGPANGLASSAGPTRPRPAQPAAAPAGGGRVVRPAAAAGRRADDAKPWRQGMKRADDGAAHEDRAVFGDGTRPRYAAGPEDRALCDYLEVRRRCRRPQSWRARASPTDTADAPATCAGIGPQPWRPFPHRVPLRRRAPAGYGTGGPIARPGQPRDERRRDA
jgi:hypothetical protein